MMRKGKYRLTRYTAMIAATALCVTALAQDTTDHITEKTQGHGIVLDNDVAIGTSPSSAFSVYESTALGSTAGNSQLYSRFMLNADGNALMNYLFSYRDANGAGWTTARLHDAISVDGSFQTPGSNTKTWWERDPYHDIQQWGTGATSYMTLYSTGLVLPGGRSISVDHVAEATGSHGIVFDDSIGIGVTSPSATFDVNGGMVVRGNDIRFNTNNNANSTIWLNNNSSGPGSPGVQYYIKSYDYWGSTLNFICDGDNGDEVMNVTFDGKVSVGTTNPDTFKLAVNGTIKAKGIVVSNTGWSDFVFKKGYNLKPLAEVEKFIKTNKHLEGIPTEKEVAKNGVSIGDMQAKLLEKIEGLTLYVIELKKENVALQERISKLEN